MLRRSGSCLFFPLLPLLAGLVTAGGEPEVPAGKGRVDESGKFVPAEGPSSTVREPDPAERLAELGAAVEGDKLRLGEVEIDRSKRTLSFPAKVNAVEGVIEYALVTGKGKTHEALLVTDALPRDIHLGCLLLAGPAAGKTPGQVRIEVTWQTNGPEKRLPLEDLIVFAKDHPQGAQGGGLAPGPWTYSGSKIDAAGFVASREGSLIALIHDDTALVNNPRPGREDDTLHVPGRRLLPPAGTPVRLILHPLPPASSHPDSTESP